MVFFIIEEVPVFHFLVSKFQTPSTHSHMIGSKKFEKSVKFRYTENDAIFHNRSKLSHISA